MPGNTVWLGDKSALIRLPDARDAVLWRGRLDQGLIRAATPTVLEIGFSARTALQWYRDREVAPLALMPTEYLTPQAEKRAVEVQGLLAARGQHRAPSIPDLLIAAVAETADLTVLHVDKDFELIAEITGQPLERLELAG